MRSRARISSDGTAEYRKQGREWAPFTSVPYYTASEFKEAYRLAVDRLPEPPSKDEEARAWVEVTVQVYNAKQPIPPPLPPRIGTHITPGQRLTTTDEVKVDVIASAFTRHFHKHPVGPKPEPKKRTTNKRTPKKKASE